MKKLAGNMKSVTRWKGAGVAMSALLLLLTTVASLAQTSNSVRVQVKNLTESRIRLIGPANPARDQFLNFALHGLEDPSRPDTNAQRDMNVEALKPVMVVVANNTEAAIVAYALVFAGTDAGGRPLRLPTRHIQPYALRHGATPGYNPQKPGGVIAPKRRKIVTPFGAFDEGTGLSVSSNPQEAVDFLNLFQGGQITIELDAVILDDGTILGPDTSNLVDCFTASLFANQDVLEHLTNPRNMEVAIGSNFGSLMSLQLSRAHTIASEEYISQYQNYKSLAVEELRDIQRLSGNDKLRMFVSREYARYTGVPQLKRHP